MKLLKRMLLINWHYFWNELVEFEGINFLTGKNAAGKSTIIDAMQLLMLGDTNGYYFNKAANEKSGRTLKGYLRGELGDDGDVGFRYLREGRFTSYIACEFHDDVKKADFTLGIVFDTYEDGTFEHKFFVLDYGIPDNRFIINNVPMSFKQVRDYIKRNFKKGKYEFPESNRRYQDILKGKLGGLKNKYFSLFKKAVPFSPITDIQTFITEYVCDVKNSVDISLMQDNIRHYKRLEQDAEMMKKRISALEEITLKYKSYYEESQRLEIQSYIIKRAQYQSAQDSLLGLNNEVESNKKKAAGFSVQQEECKAELKKLTADRDRYITDKNSSDIYRKTEELEKDKASIAKELEALRGNLKKTINSMRKYGLLWRAHAGSIEHEEKALSIEKNEIMDFGLNELQKEWDALCTLAVQVREYAEMLVDVNHEHLVAIGAEGFARIRNCVNSLNSTAAGIGHSLKRVYNDAEKRMNTAKDQFDNLKKGIKPYDPKLLELRQDISNALMKKHGKLVEVYILADLLEVRDEHWSKAIEAYLHTQKFYLFVEPEYFIDALKVYDKLKFEKSFYDWGLVDTGKLVAQPSVRKEGSLAEEVLTDNHYARLFIDRVMGRLVKCQKVEELREHERAITASCMLYQNFVARQLNPVRWQEPYIGRKAIEEQIKSKKSEIARWEAVINLCEKRLDKTMKISSMEIINTNEAENVLLVIEKAGAIPELEKKQQAVIAELGSLDLTWLIKLNEQIQELEKKIGTLDAKERELNNKKVAIETRTTFIIDEKIPAEKKNVEDWQKKLEEGYSEEWIAENGEPRFLKELKARNSAYEVYRSFYTQVSRTESQVKKKKEELVSSRSSYNRDYKMSYDINLDNNKHYDKEKADLLDVKLPEYIKQITDAKEKAYEEFREDFLAKLKANIDMAKSQIEELNYALKESSFGSDRYRFVLNPKPEYRRYYDMITDDMLLEGFNIGSHVFREKHRDAIDELFKQIVDVDSELSADVRAEMEKNIKKFTDYRTYLNFDLIVTDGEDNNQRLSRTLLKKSGGETQTPFYISILASFAQLYRIKQKNDSSNTSRLIIFDEAFSKMDSGRIQESIKLLRRFGLQAVLSAPPEKIGDIAPLVDRNLCVIRQGENSCVKAFDSREVVEETEYEVS